MDRLNVNVTNFSEWLSMAKLPCKVISSDATCDVYTIEDQFHLLSTRFAYDSDVEKSINLFNEFLTEYNKLKKQVDDVSRFIYGYNTGQNHNSALMTQLVLLVLKYKSVLPVVINNNDVHSSKEVISSEWIVENNELVGTIYLHPLFDKMSKNPSKIIESDVSNFVRIAGVGSIVNNLIHTMAPYNLKNFTCRVDNDNYLKSLLFGVQFGNVGMFEITMGTPNSVPYSVMTGFLPPKKVDYRKVLISVTGLNKVVPLVELSNNAKINYEFITKPNVNFIFSINTFSSHTTNSFADVVSQLSRNQILPGANPFVNLKQPSSSEEAYTDILRLITLSYMSEPVIKPITKAEAVIKSGEIVKQIFVEPDSKKVAELAKELHRLNKILAGD